MNTLKTIFLVLVLANIKNGHNIETEFMDPVAQPQTPQTQVS